MLCGNFQSINIYVEYYYGTLEKEIEKRKKKGIFFEEEEIWILFE